jgi:hypothetical protein
LEAGIFQVEDLAQFIESNPLFLFNEYKNLQGATLNVYNGSSSHATAAGNVFRTQLVKDLGTEIAALFTSDDTMPIFLERRIYYDFQSDTQFLVIPFIVLLENGETVSAYDYNATNGVAAAISGSLPAQTRNIVYGPVVKSHMIRDNGANLHICRTGLNFRSLANLYVKHYREYLMTEDSPFVLQLGITVQSVASKTIYWYYHGVDAWAQVDPAISGDL